MSLRVERLDDESDHRVCSGIGVDRRNRKNNHYRVLRVKTWHMIVPLVDNHDR